MWRCALEREWCDGKGMVCDGVRWLQVLLMQYTPAHACTCTHTHTHTHTHTQELELTARAHGISTPSMTTETQKLAEAAEQALG